MFFNSSSAAGFLKGATRALPLRYALPALLMGLSAANAGATPIVVPGFSFESPVQTEGVFALTADFWVGSGSGAHESGAFNPTSASFTGATGGNLPGTADGAQGAYLHAGGTASANLTSGALGAIQANTTYKLTVAMGQRADFLAAGQSISEASIEILANGISVASFGIDARTLPVGTFGDYSVSLPIGAVNALIGQSISVRVGHAADLNSAFVADNVRLDSTVPEPSTAALLVGASLLTLARRNRAK